MYCGVAVVVEVMIRSECYSNFAELPLPV